MGLNISQIWGSYALKKALSKALGAMVKFSEGQLSQDERGIVSTATHLPLPNFRKVVQRAGVRTLLEQGLPAYLDDLELSVGARAYAMALRPTKAVSLQLFGRMPLPYLRLATAEQEQDWSVKVSGVQQPDAAFDLGHTLEDAYQMAEGEVLQCRQQLSFLYSLGKLVEQSDEFDALAREEHKAAVARTWVNHKAALSQKYMLAVFFNDERKADALTEVRSTWAEDDVADFYGCDLALLHNTFADTTPPVEMVEQVLARKTALIESAV